MTAIPQADGSLADLAENKPGAKIVRRRADARAAGNDYVLVVTTEYMFTTSSKLTQKERDAITDSAVNSDDAGAIMAGIVAGAGLKYDGDAGVDYKHEQALIKSATKSGR